MWRSIAHRGRVKVRPTARSVTRAMWEMVERTDDQPGTGSATYCSAVSWRQASRTLVLAQRSYANNATTSSCMRISPGLGQGHCRYCRGDNPGLTCCLKLGGGSPRVALPGKCRVSAEYSGISGKKCQFAPFQF